MSNQSNNIKMLSEAFFAHQPLRVVKGLVSAYVAYPIAERVEKRTVRPKLQELRRYYKLPFEHRKNIATNRLYNTLSFAAVHIPYYRDLFRQLGFNSDKIKQDVGYLGDLPLLTKEIIREQGERMLSGDLSETRHHACKTGGSTGVSSVIYYDQEAADYSSAVTLYSRERAGNYKYRSELHFAARFSDIPPPRWPSREDFKCLAMNRSNIFFDRIDDEGLEDIWATLKRRRPYMVHAHPSTIYALACYVERVYGGAQAFDVFESSGELLKDYMRQTIEHALRCRVVDRYGLAELGVMAYELDGHEHGLQVLDSEGWPESVPAEEGGSGEEKLIFTGFRNKFMPLIRYETGDLAVVQERQDGFFLTNLVGRIHDLVQINGIEHPTHHIQDILDHRVGGIQEFQIDLRTQPATLNIVPESWASPEEIDLKIRNFWQDGFTIRFIGHDDLVRVGRHAKFRHVVHP